MACHGRFAPSPSGRLHVGSARTALVAWLSARSEGGTFTLRIEDLDAQRAVGGMARCIVDDLLWLGLDFDAGPDAGGSHGPYFQSARLAGYDRALRRLHGAGRLFPCRLSRRELRNIARAPHGAAQNAPYPASLRPKQLEKDWYTSAVDAAIRFRVPDRPVVFTDLVYGYRSENVAETCGDFVLRRRDGQHAYQLAVVVDDVTMGITQVVRGADLLGSTARQLLLFEALGADPPRFGHVPLAVNEQSIKLSKRDGSLAVSALRRAGIRADVLVGHLAWSLGIISAPAPRSAASLLPCFMWSRITRTEPWTVPDNLTAILLSAHP